MTQAMETSLFSAFRLDRDLRSAMLGVCVLFVLTGLIGAFASAAGAGGSSIESFATDHCYSDADSDGAGVIPSCCGAIGCPMVGSALPGPVTGASLTIRLSQQIAVPRPELPIVPTALTVALDTARGPPLSF
jgi:hypothetical protein